MSKVKRIHTDIPKWHSVQGVPTFMGAVLGFFVWALVFLIFLFTAYVTWFNKALVQILKGIKNKPYQVPFWFGALIVILFFPITLLVILISAFLQIIRH